MDHNLDSWQLTDISQWLEATSGLYTGSGTGLKNRRK